MADSTTKTTVEHTESREKKTRKNKKKKGTKAWTLTSNEYKEFAALCDSKGWESRKFLPRSGDQIGRELDALIAKGLNNSGIPFSRAQVNLKFKQWKATKQALVTSKLLNPLKIDSTELLIAKLKCEPVWQGIVQRSIVKNVHGAPSFEMISKDWLHQALDALRSNLIDATNMVLTTHNGTDGSTQFSTKQIECLGKFYREFVEQVLRCTEEKWSSYSDSIRPLAKGVAINLGQSFVESLSTAIKRGGHAGDSMADSVKAAALSFEDSSVKKTMTDKNLFNGSVYNIAGWLLSAIRSDSRRRKDDSPIKKVLSKIIEGSDVTYKKDELRMSLPTEKVDRTVTRKPNALHYVSMEFFELVQLMEFVSRYVLPIVSYHSHHSLRPDLRTDAGHPISHHLWFGTCSGFGQRNLAHSFFPSMCKELFRS